MKRVVVMLMLGFFARSVVALDVDINALKGVYWYGLYLNGQKSGWSKTDIEVHDDKTISISEDAVIRVSMAGMHQDMQFNSKRVYAPDGSLMRIDSTVDDPSGKSVFVAIVSGDKLKFTSTVAGTSNEEDLPRPKETLDDILKQRNLVGPDAKVGDKLTFNYFEPLYKKELHGQSTIVKEEQRRFDGALTNVFVVKTKVDALNLDTLSYVTENGTLLEDVTAGFITMRLEPKQMAKDVTYSNDVTVANAVMLDHPIADPRTRQELHLQLDGPLTNEHIYNDERQHMAAENGHFDFTSHALSLKGFKSPKIPLKLDANVAQWLKPTMFVQSNDPRLIAKAKEIIGDETDAEAISEKLCHWVYQHVESRYSARLTNALEVLNSLEGDCTEHSVLFVGLARAAGLPAREVAGLVYVNEPEPGFFFHQWAKVWIGKWIDVDPTFDQPVADTTHIKLSEGDLLAQTRLIPVIGRIKIKVLDNETATTKGDKSD